MYKSFSRVRFFPAAAAVLVACLVLFGVADVGWADLRIVEKSEDGQTETLYSNNKIVVPMPDGSKTMLFCDIGELVMVSPSRTGRYWQGSFDDFRTSIEQLFATDDEEEDVGLGDLGALFGALFGGEEDDEGETAVRITQAGKATILGYEADHYVVETGSDGNWRVYEELWMSPVLFDELAAEAPKCIDMILEVQGELMPGFATGFTDLDEVIQSAEYQELWTRGFPVRRKDIMSFFGMSFETVREVVEVSRDTIAEDVFSIPSGYTRVDHPLEMMSFDDM